MKEKHLPKTLRRLISEKFDSQSAFAKLLSFDRIALSRDVTGRSGHVPDDRFHEYLLNFDHESRLQLIRARLFDLVPDELHESLVTSDNKTSEPAIPYAVELYKRRALGPRERQAFEFLAKHAEDDEEFSLWIQRTAEFLGWEPLTLDETE